MDEAEKQRIIQETLVYIKEWEQNMTVTGGPYKNSQYKDYSLAQVQLTDGSVIGMTITASPTLGAHLTKEMGSTGYLYIYNESESLMIKADRVMAVKLTKLTKE